MKNIGIIIILLIGVSISTACTHKTHVANSNLAQAGILLTEGSDLIYKVTDGEDTYPYEININQFDDALISFDWEMDYGTRSGTIAMHGETLIRPMKLYNDFSGGYDDLKDQTAVWISKDLFHDLRSGMAVEIDLGNGVKETFQLWGPERWTFGAKRNKTYDIPIFIVMTADEEKEIWIADDPQNRMIVMMDIDSKIELVDFKPYE